MLVYLTAIVTAACLVGHGCTMAVPLSEQEAADRRQMATATTAVLLHHSGELLTPDPTAALLLQSDRRERMRLAARQELARRAFLSLKSSDYTDPPLPSVVDDQQQTKRRQRRRRKNRKRKGKKRRRDRKKFGRLWLSKEERRRRRKYKNLPSKKEARIIATKAMLGNNQETCKTEPLKQRVRMEGCKSRTVLNRFCHGRCNSFFVPRLQTQRLRPAFESCSACRPVDFNRVTIQLVCPGNRSVGRSETPSVITRTIVVVKRCGCRAVDVGT